MPGYITYELQFQQVIRFFLKIKDCRKKKQTEIFRSDKTDQNP